MLLEAEYTTAYKIRIILSFIIDNAYNVTEKNRRTIENVVIHNNDDKPIRVTISIVHSSINENSTLEQTIKDADSAVLG